MDAEVLERANKILAEIKELDLFLHTFNSCWKGEIDVTMGRWTLCNKPFGLFARRHLEVDTTLKKRISSVIEIYKEELEQELKTL